MIMGFDLSNRISGRHVTNIEEKCATATDNASTDSEPNQWQVATAGEDAPLSCTRSSKELFNLIINIIFF
jgi:hypothetical protein